MKKLVAGAMMVVMLAGILLPAQANPLALLLGIPLLNKLTEKKETVSDSSAYARGYLLLDGKAVGGGVPDVGSTFIVVPKMRGHESTLVLDPHLNIRPALTDGIKEVKLVSNQIPDLAFDTNYARQLAVRNGSSIPCKGGRWEQDWLVKLDINKFDFGLHSFDLDVFFRNGRNKRDSFRVPVTVFVTSLDVMKAGVNDSDTQTYLRQLSGSWTTIPITGTIDIDLTDETAERGGFADSARSAGIPSNGTVDTRVIGSERVGIVSTGDSTRDKLAMYARQAGIIPKDLFETEVKNCEPGRNGIPFVVVFLQNNELVKVPAEVIITDRAGRTYPPISSRNGDGVILVGGLKGEEKIQLQINGKAIDAALAVQAGCGYWLVIKPGGA